MQACGIARFYVVVEGEEDLPHLLSHFAGRGEDERLCVCVCMCARLKKVK